MQSHESMQHPQSRPTSRPSSPTRRIALAVLVSSSAIAGTACVDLDIPTAAQYDQAMLAGCGAARGVRGVRGERGAPSVESEASTRACVMMGGAPQPPRR